MDLEYYAKQLSSLVLLSTQINKFRELEQLIEGDELADELNCQ